ncbi:MAG: putative addiction module antidote protein [Cardiobacteriaceae bacterium]|nr:putative addiction module antidote protein [Cardiobacteriaceae bacterium]
MMKTFPFEASRYLHTEAEITTYLQVAAEEAGEMGDHTILLRAIETAAKARGMMQIAKAAGVSRESLYKSLAADAKPRYETIVKVLDAMGMQIMLTPKP